MGSLHSATRRKRFSTNEKYKNIAWNTKIARMSNSNKRQRYEKDSLTVYMCSRRFRHPPLYLSEWRTVWMTLQTMIPFVAL
jgi:hypothetical protein